MIDMNENRDKFRSVLLLMESLHKEVLYSFLHRDVSTRITNLIKRSLTTPLFVNFTNPSEIKRFLFEMVVSLKDKYQKLIDLQINNKDIYQEIISEINRLFPVFPNDFTEFEFEKTMNKAFEENNINTIPQNVQYYKNNYDYKNYK